MSDLREEIPKCGYVLLYEIHFAKGGKFEPYMFCRHASHLYDLT